MARLSNTTEFDETDRNRGGLKMDPADETKLAANIELPASPAEELDISDIIDEREREKLQEQGAEPVSRDDGKGSKTVLDTSTIKAASVNTKANTLCLLCSSSAFIFGYMFDVALLTWLFVILGAVFLLLPAETVEEIVDPVLAFEEKAKDLVVRVYDHGVNKIIEAALGEDENGMDQADGDDGEANEEQEDADQEHDE